MLLLEVTAGAKMLRAPEQTERQSEEILLYEDRTQL